MSIFSIVTGGSYEGAAHGRRMRGWNPGSAGPVKAVAPGHETLRNRARDAARNEPLAAAIVRSWVSALVGSGITCRTPASEIAARDRVESLWREWLPCADASGTLGDFYGLQAMAARSFVEAGECFVRVRPRRLEDGLPVPLQIQLLESDMVPGIDRTLANGNVIVQGIEFDAIGRRVAYWMYRNHPGDNWGDLSNLTRVPAEFVSHVFAPDRPGQVRGVSVLAPVLTRLRSLGDFVDAASERAKLANLLVGFVTRAPSTGDATLDPITGRPIVTDTDGTPMAAMEPGTMQELLPGEDVRFSDPPQPGAEFAEFVRSQISGIAAGAGGVPTEFLTGDLRDVSDRSLRVSLNEWRRVCEAVQWQIIIPKVCQPVRNAWADAALLGGLLTSTEADAARRSEWTPPRHRHLHPTQDVQGLKLEVEAGFRSRSSVIAEYGQDALDVDSERAADVAREDALGVASDAARLANAEAAKLEAEAEAALRNAESAMAAAAEARANADKLKIELGTASEIRGSVVSEARNREQISRLELEASRLGLAELRGEIKHVA